jgi:hypothetical protein
LIAVRNTSLRNTDLDAGSWVVQQLDVLSRTIRQAQLYVDMGASKNFPIPLAEAS